MHITGTTRLYGIVGDPLAKARSPEFLNGLSTSQRADAVLGRRGYRNHRPIEVILRPTLVVGGRELQHEIGGRDEAGLDAGHDRPIGQRQGDMALADTARSEQDDVLGAGNEGQGRQFLDLCPRCAAGEAEITLLKCSYAWATWPT